MNYNTSLQTNNAELQALIDIANTLPEASEVQATPVISVNTSGLITATAGTKSSTHQLAFQPAKTIIPSTVSQIAVSSGYYTGGDITVNPIPSEYIVPSGTLIITANGTHDVKNYASATVEVAGSNGDAAEWSANEDAIITRGISGTYVNDRVENIGSYAFNNCSRLTTANFPACTSIGVYAFNNCPRLTSASFPACTSIGNYAFQYCYSLTSISFPVCTSIGRNAFYSCSGLTSISFPACTTINGGAFGSCRRLSSLTLRASTVCTLSNSSAFTSTPYAGYSSYFSGTPYIYVPSSLVNAYKTATNWTYFASYITAMRDA